MSGFSSVIRLSLLSVLISLTGGLTPLKAQHDDLEVNLSAGFHNTNIRNDGQKVGSAINNLYGGLTFVSPALVSADSASTVNAFRLSAEPHYLVAGADFNDPDRYIHKFHFFSVPLHARVQVFSAFDAFIGASGAFLITDFRQKNRTDPDKLPLNNPERFHTMGTAGIEAPISDNLNLRLAYRRSLQGLSEGFRLAGLQLGLTYELSRAIKRQQQEEQIQPTVNKTANRHIRRLKNGILLVRLNSERKKLKELQEALKKQAPAPGTRQYYRLQDQINDLKKERKQRHQRIIEAFEEEFRFSAYAFFYDYQTDSVLGRQWPEVSFRKPGQADAYQPDPEQPRYVLDLGSSYLKRENQRFSGMVVRDTSLMSLKEPFPAKYPNTKTFSFLDLDKNVAKMVRKLNAGLKEFYLDQKEPRSSAP
jgi:hypothetical protein